MEKFTTKEKIVEFDCLEHVYADRTRVQICGLHFVMHQGERVAILGPNGCGKTTLLKHVLGLLKPTKGTISVFGLNPFTDFLRIREKIGVVMQDVDEQILGPTVAEDVAFTLRNYGYKHDIVTRRVNDVLTRLEMDELKNKLVYYISGGEKRKVALAGALVLAPRLLVLDEPFEHLDYKSTHNIVDYLNTLSSQNSMSIIYAIHELHLVPQIADTVYLLKQNGEIGASGEAGKVLTSATLSDYNLEMPHV